MDSQRYIYSAGYRTGRRYSQEREESDDGENQQTDVKECAAIESVSKIIASVPTKLLEDSGVGLSY